VDILGDMGTDSEEDSQKRKREGDEWLQRKRRKALRLQSDDEAESDSGDDLLNSGEENELEQEEETGDDNGDGDGDDDHEDDSDDGEFGGFSDKNRDDDPTAEDEYDPLPLKTRENPYVAPVTNGRSERVYVPPSLPAASTEESGSQMRLRRQAQGLLNKLSEANLVSILGEIEKLYREYPRQNVTSTMIGLLLGLVCDRSALQDTFIILHAGFIAAIYKVVGMGFGAEFVQKFVETFDRSDDQKNPFTGKEPINLMSLLSQLYNFHVIGSNLVFDYIRLFLNEITEVNTEFLLKIIRSTL
jgi:nucleolar MIF4G domain-containing protein 1